MEVKSKWRKSGKLFDKISLILPWRECSAILKDACYNWHYFPQLVATHDGEI